MKKEILVKVYDLSIDLEGPLQDVKDELDHLAHVYGSKFSKLRLEWEQEPYGDSYRYYLYGWRMQTDEEYQRDLDLIARREQAEREQFERLKEKYG